MLLWWHAELLRFCPSFWMNGATISEYVSECHQFLPPASSGWISSIMSRTPGDWQPWDTRQDWSNWPWWMLSKQVCFNQKIINPCQTIDPYIHVHYSNFTCTNQNDKQFLEEKNSIFQYFQKFFKPMWLRMTAPLQV